MGSYYLTASQIRAYDSRILAAIIVALGITSAEVAEALPTKSCTIDTDGGQLQLTLHMGYNGDMPNRGKVGLLGYVSGRFTNPDEAINVVAGVNKFSGKWNFMFHDQFTAEDMVDIIKSINPRNFQLRERFWYPGASQENIDARAAM